MKNQPWPIIQWIGNGGKLYFRVEDDQGYNFSFDTRKDAEWFREACSDYNAEMELREKDMVNEYRRSLRA